MTERKTKAIVIDQLRVGMFVTKLDISWLDSPFMSHSKFIKTEKDVESLKDAGVKQLTIDLSRGKGLENHLDQPSQSEVNPAEPKAEVRPEPPVEKPALVTQSKLEPIKTSLKQEMNAALAIRGKIKETVNQILASFDANEPIDMEELTPLVDHALNSLERNDQALMNLVHLSRKSKKLADHTFGTFCLVLNLSLVRGIDERDREQLCLAALLHEAGWTQLPLNLMGKRTRYSAHERKLVEKHVTIGEKVLSRSQLPELTRRIIAEHHEHQDGSGYPNGLKLDQIHPLSAILAVVDAYEERVHQLTDMPGMVPTNAVRALYKEAEKGVFCTDVVASLIKMLGIYPVSTGVVLNTGEKALVVELHKETPLKPSLKIVYDGNGKAIDPIWIDLREQGANATQRAIESVVDPHSRQVDPLGRLKLDEDDFL